MCLYLFIGVLKFDLTVNVVGEFGKVWYRTEQIGVFVFNMFAMIQ